MEAARTSMIRYVIAIAAVSAAALIRLALDPWLGERYSLGIFYGAVALAVWAGGYGPAVLAAALSYVTADLLFISPRGYFHVLALQDVVGLLGYVISCSAIVLVGEALRRTKAEVSAQATRLLEVSRRKSNFIATVAHELRNPLAPLKNSLLIMEDPRFEEHSKSEALQVARRQAAAMERLVEDLLDVSKVEQGKIRFQSATADVASVIKQAIEVAKPHIESKAQILSVKLPQQPLFVNVDERRMVQVFSNLLNNASKFAPPKGAISIGGEHRLNEAVITVKDNGIGIAREELKSIFDAFFQSTGGLGQDNSGLGLGLSVSSALVKMHGGSLEASSPGVGKGSEFSVRLPLARTG